MEVGMRYGGVGVGGMSARGVRATNEPSHAPTSRIRSAKHRRDSRGFINENVPRIRSRIRSASPSGFQVFRPKIALLMH